MDLELEVDVRVVANPPKNHGTFVPLQTKPCGKFAPPPVKKAIPKLKSPPLRHAVEDESDTPGSASSSGPDDRAALGPKQPNYPPPNRSRRPSRFGSHFPTGDRPLPPPPKVSAFCEETDHDSDDSDYLLPPLKKERRDRQ